MTTSSKTPLHAVVSVICDCLSDLTADDQARALEAARVTLGLKAPVARDPDRSFQEVSRAALPTVQVEMMGGAPMVVGTSMSRPDRTLLVLGSRQGPLRQLPAPSQGNTAQARGYVRPMR